LLKKKSEKKHLVLLLLCNYLNYYLLLSTKLLRQQIELIATEGVKLHFEDDAIREIARMAALLNKTVENIGARRLHTVIERIMEQISFDVAEEGYANPAIVHKKLVQERLSDVVLSNDLSRYIL